MLANEQNHDRNNESKLVWKEISKLIEHVNEWLDFKWTNKKENARHTFVYEFGFYFTVLLVFVEYEQWDDKRSGEYSKQNSHDYVQALSAPQLAHFYFWWWNGYWTRVYTILNVVKKLKTHYYFLSRCQLTEQPQADAS
jgi:hypothetical protein